MQSLLILSNLFGVSIDSLVKEDSRKMQDALAAGAKKMARLGVVMMAFGLACPVWVIMGIVWDLDLALIAVPALALFIPAMVAALLVDKMRHDNQLYAYQSSRRTWRARTPRSAAVTTSAPASTGLQGGSCRPSWPSSSACAAGGSGITVLVDADGKPLVTPLDGTDPVAMGQLLDRE